MNKIIVYATSFLDDLLTHPAEEGKAVKLLKDVSKKHNLELVFQCDRNPLEPVRAEELDGVIAVIADLEIYSEEVLLKAGTKQGGSLKIIARYGAGYNNVDLSAAEKAGIIVTNTPGANSLPTAEWAVSTLMAVAGRRIPHYERASIGELKTGPSRLDISGKTLGIIGTGNIGKNVELLLKGYNMKILAADLYPDNKWAAENNVKYTDIYDICKNADFITLHTSGGTQIIDEKNLSLMKKTTALINCARGILVDNRAVYNSVKEGRLWGYGIDEVWEYPNLPLTGLNIVASPHVGADTDYGKLKMQLMSAQSVIDLLEGREQPHAVSR